MQGKLHSVVENSASITTVRMDVGRLFNYIVVEVVAKELGFNVNVYLVSLDQRDVSGFPNDQADLKVFFSDGLADLIERLVASLVHREHLTVHLYDSLGLSFAGTVEFTEFHWLFG